MILFNRKKSVNLTASEKERRSRLRRTIKPTTQNTIGYTSLYENGLMHITGNEYSNTYRLGDANYTTVDFEQKINIIETMAEAINSFDAGDNFQMLVVQRRLNTDVFQNLLFGETGDQYDQYREEYDALITSRIDTDKKNFQIDKYITIKTDAYDRSLAETQLNEIGVSFENQMKQLNVEFSRIDGIERMAIFMGLLRNNFYPTYDYRDIALSGLKTKDFISPNRISFREDKMKIDNRWAQVLYVRQYPTFLSDKLIKKLTDVGIEMAITVQAEPYDPAEIAKKLKNQQMEVKGELIKQQKEALKAGVTDPDLAVGSVAKEIKEATDKWDEEINEHDQKVFLGMIAVMVTGDSEEELKVNVDKIKTAGRKLNVDFEPCYYHQEEALNSMLPIGKTYLNVKRKFLRDMTTANVATQIPFSNVDLQSESPNALYYGQNQLTNNVITLDRKRDLNAANGVIYGSSGSGKSTSTKTLEVIPSYLKYKDDRFIIVDPEDEYTGIAHSLDGQVIDIFNGSQSHINILDLPDQSKLTTKDGQKVDPIGDKSDLLMSIFETILTEVYDEDFTIIDRVTRQTYKRFEDLQKMPTLSDWHDVLLEQPEARAKKLAIKLEIYAKGSQNLFAHETNVNLQNRMIVFNLKRLKDGKLKDIALLVIQDFIWNQVIANQGIFTTRIYIDEVQVYFKRPLQAAFFSDIYSRFRKYGAIPTAMTQNIITMTQTEEGFRLLSNSEFMILLKHKPQDLIALKKVIDLPPGLEDYLTKPKEVGSGLIVAGTTIVPFKNLIPKNLKIYDLASTDA